MNAHKKETLAKDLASDYSALSKLAKLDLGAFAPIVNVAPSIITVGYPAVRVFTYNVSGLNEDGKPGRSGEGTQKPLGDDNDDIGDDEDSEDIARYKEPVFTRVLYAYVRSSLRTLAKNCQLKKNSSSKKCRIKHTHSNPSSPCRTNTALTPLGYTQVCIYTQLATGSSWVC